LSGRLRSDRDVVLNDAGSKRRIFHVVRPHERHLPSGDVRIIKMHHRGMRTFDWNGYAVHITVLERATALRSRGGAAQEEIKVIDETRRGKKCDGGR
jgi:hypothetical protein